MPHATLEGAEKDGAWRELVRTRPLELRVKAALAELPEAAPTRPETDAAVLSGANHAAFARQFEEAKVPYCLHADGLKRQSTFFLNGYIALPFIVVARARGKCLF